MRTIRNCFASVARRFVTGLGMGWARILTLAEILGLEKFGQADDVCAARRGLVDLVDGVLQIPVGVGRGGHLYQSDIEFLRQQTFPPEKRK
jgi:hypothetical protein